MMNATAVDRHPSGRYVVFLHTKDALKSEPIRQIAFPIYGSLSVQFWAIRSVLIFVLGSGLGLHPLTAKYIEAYP